MQVHLISFPCNCKEFVPADLRLWGVFHSQTLVFYTRSRKVILPWSKLIISVLEMIMIRIRKIWCKLFFKVGFHVTYVNPTKLCGIENMRHS